MKFLSNLYTFEDLTNSKDIIINEKISYHKIYRLGNVIFGIFMIKGGSIFSYQEALITFPFKSKTEYRGFMNNKNLTTFMIWSNRNTLDYMIPHSIEIPNQTIGNFYFII